MQRKLERLEAADQGQARGMDTQARIPALAMAAELISMVCFRWVSVPDLKYSLYAGAGKLWKLEETAAGIAWAYDVPESMTRGRRSGGRTPQAWHGSEHRAGTFIYLPILSGEASCGRSGKNGISMERRDDRGCAVVGYGHEQRLESSGRQGK